MGVESKKLGKTGEDLAARYLEGKGLKIIKRNYKVRGGEIDLVCKDKDVVVFVEVKNYSDKNFYLPSFSIDRKKRKCLINAAISYLYENGLNDFYCRFDVVTIFRKDAGTINKIEHYENAFCLNDY